MQFNLINHDKTRLLIFFGGFYTDYNCFEEFDTKTSDILFINDYSKLDFDELLYFNFTPYTEINLLAYSYGVWAAGEAYKCKALPLNINKSISIAGTFCPIHPVYGINPKVFNIMLNALSVSTINRFEQNMLANCKFEDGSVIKKAERSLENLREELITIKNNCSQNIPENIEDILRFDTAILTKEDKIFPYRAQEAFYSLLEERGAGPVAKVVLDEGHFPFFSFKTFDKILEL